MIPKILQDLYNEYNQMFVLYTTKQFKSQFFDISKINYTNKQSKMYYYEIFFNEDTSSSLNSIYIKTDNLIHNVQLNYYTLQLHSKINKLLYPYGNQLISIRNKFVEINNTTIYIYPIILIYNNKLYHIKNSQFHYDKNDYVFEIRIPSINLDIDEKLQVFIKVKKTIDYFSEIQEKNRIFKNLNPDEIQSFVGNDVVNYLQSINKTLILIQISNLIKQLNDYYLSTTSPQEKLNVEQIYNDLVKNIILLKNKIENNTIDSKFITYLECHLQTLSLLMNEKNKYDYLYSNNYINILSKEQIYKLSQIVHKIQHNEVLENVLDNTTDNTLKEYFNLIETQILNQITSLLNSNHNKVLTKLSIVFLNLLYQYFIQQLLEIQTYLSSETDIYNGLYSLYNNSSNKVVNIINMYNNRTLPLPFYMDLFNLYVKMYNSNIIIDSELNSQISSVKVESTQFLTKINKKFKQQNKYIFVDNEIYFKDDRYDNIYVRYINEYNSRDFDNVEILIYIGDIVFKGSNDILLL